MEESVGFGAVVMRSVVMRSVVRRVLWRRWLGSAWLGSAWLGSAWGARVLDAAAGLGVNAAPATSLSGPLWGRAGANAAAAGLGVNVAPARGWSGPQRCGAARLRAQGWRCLAARLFACAAARAAKVGSITAK